MAPSLNYLRQIALAVPLLILTGPGTPAFGQTFDQFRLIGNHSGNHSGFLTSIHLDRDQSRATIQYLNVAGSSTELTVDLRPSSTITETTSTFLPSSEFLQPEPASLNLADIEFFHGSVFGTDVSDAPPHWFRLTYFNNRWSGVFRVDNRIYSLDRYTSDETIAVRPATQGDHDFLPAQRARISAVIDENYIHPDVMDDQIGMDNLGHVFALESVHVLDGLLTDSLGLSLWLEQVIYQPSSALGNGLGNESGSTSSTPDAALAEAERWTDLNAEAFGLTDNLAILFFRGWQTSAPNTPPDPGLINDHIAVIPNTSQYQFATAHSFGQLLQLPYDTNTVQHWHKGTTTALPEVLWSDRQQTYLLDHPLPQSLVQTISYDAPQISDPTEDQTPGEIDKQLLIAEQPESQGLLNEDDPDSPRDEASTGAGSMAPGFLLLLVLSRRIRHDYRQRAHNRQPVS